MGSMSFRFSEALPGWSSNVHTSCVWRKSKIPHSSDGRSSFRHASALVRLDPQLPPRNSYLPHNPIAMRRIRDVIGYQRLAENEWRTLLWETMEKSYPSGNTIVFDWGAGRRCVSIFALCLVDK